MEIQVDSAHVIKALQDELASVNGKLIMQTAVTLQLQADKMMLESQLRAAHERLDIPQPESA